MRIMVPCLLAIILAIGSLSSRAAEPELMVTAPSGRIGLTVQKSPVLYYFISQVDSLSTRIIFVLFDVRDFAPIAEVNLNPPTHPGLWAIRLGDYHIVLEEEVRYSWYVVTTQDANSHKGDIVAGGMIERVGPQHVDNYDSPCDKKIVQYLLEAGVWYDAFACVNDLIEADSQDQSLRDLQGEVIKKGNEKKRTEDFDYRNPFLWTKPPPGWLWLLAQKRINDAFGGR